MVRQTVAKRIAVMIVTESTCCYRPAVRMCGGLKLATT